MAIKFKHSNQYSTYFVTFTCVQWISLFEITNAYEHVYAWFLILSQKFSANIVSYVIMPNHLHLVIHFKEENFDLNKIISNGKRFIAYEIIKKLEQNGHLEILQKLSDLVTERERKKGQLHKVFKESFDAKAIMTEKFLLQKINYIHNNPVSKKWMLAKDFVCYEHSSASYYEEQKEKHYRPLHYLDL